MSDIYFNDIILRQYMQYRMPMRVAVAGTILQIPTPEDVSDPRFGFGMDENGRMHPFSYQDVEKIYLGTHQITVDDLRKEKEAQAQAMDTGEDGPEPVEPDLGDEGPADTEPPKKEPKPKKDKPEPPKK